MAKPRDDRQQDLLRPALEEIIDLGHPLVRLARGSIGSFSTGALPACVRPERVSRRCRPGWWRGCSS
jgi:transposase, IS5 family